MDTLHKTILHKEFLKMNKRESINIRIIQNTVKIGTYVSKLRK